MATTTSNNAPDAMLKRGLDAISRGDAQADSGRGMLAYAARQLIADTLSDKDNKLTFKSINEFAHAPTNKAWAGEVYGLVISAAGLQPTPDEGRMPELKQARDTQREFLRQGVRLMAQIEVINTKRHAENVAITWDDNASVWMMPTRFAFDAEIKGDADLLNRKRAVRRAPYYVQLRDGEALTKVALNYTEIEKQARKILDQKPKATRSTGQPISAAAAGGRSTASTTTGNPQPSSGAQPSPAAGTIPVKADAVYVPSNASAADVLATLGNINNEKSRAYQIAAALVAQHYDTMLQLVMAEGKKRDAAKFSKPRPAPGAKASNATSARKRA